MSAIRPSARPMGRSFIMRRKAGATLPPPPSAPACPSWEAAVARWRLQGTHRTSGTIRREEGLLQWLEPQLGGLPLNCIGKGRIEDVKAAGLAAGWSPRSVNYALGVVRAILRAAVEWEWIPVVPRIKLLKLPKKRVRWISPGQALLLLGLGVSIPSKPGKSSPSIFVIGLSGKQFLEYSRASSSTFTGNRSLSAFRTAFSIADISPGN